MGGCDRVTAMRILHLSDTHVFDPALPREERLHYGRIDPLAALEGVLEALANCGPIDAIVHSGDASNDGSQGSYRALMERLRAFAKQHAHLHGMEEPPIAVAMGNHDVASGFAEAFGSGDHSAVGSRGQQFHDRVVDCRAGRIVVLDSSVPRAGWGMLEPAQLEWLDRVLSEKGSGPTMLAVHHPPLRVESDLFQALSLGSEFENFGDGSTAEEFAELVRGRVDVIVSGHLHHAMSGAIGEVPVYVAPGVANVVDPCTADERAFALSGASVLEVGNAGVRYSSSHWPNRGDVQEQAASPVYAFDAETVDKIIRAAGRTAR